jgi:hypothetical protein
MGGENGSVLCELHCFSGSSKRELSHPEMETYSARGLTFSTKKLIYVKLAETLISCKHQVGIPWSISRSLS